jgi:hypothetical protein
MILHWRQLPLHYGGEVDAHRVHFEEAGQTTYALLCCRFAPGNDRLAPSGGDHAERKLLASPLWTQEIPVALANWSTLNHSRIVVTMAINRTPCPACTRALVHALTELQWKFALRFEHARFILACRGAYQGTISEAGFYEQATTTGDLRLLQEAGWELCVLQLSEALPPSGRELLQALERQPGVRGRVMRLGD